MSFAARLKAIRMRSNQSLQEVADKVGLSKAHLWDLEMGKSRNPSVDAVSRLANHFKVSIASLVGETDALEGESEALGVLFRGLRELDDRDRQIVQAIIDSRRNPTS